MNTVICPHCKKEVEISEALKHQITTQEREKLREEFKKELEKSKQDAIDNSTKKIKEQFELQIKLAKEDAEEKDKRIKQLIEQLTELTRALQRSKKEKDEAELEMQKKLLSEREKISEEIGKTVKEKSDLEVAEIKKQLDDTKKALEDAQRKAAQKSQQLQGEVMELALEEVLRSAFPYDDISPIAKGVLGADIRHSVKSPKGYNCGVILWEFKQTQRWEDKWIAKLKKDTRADKAMFGVIVSSILPKELGEGFGLKDGVWVCNQNLILPLATILRQNILDVGYQKAISANKEEKAGRLYSYVTSHEFQQQVENVVEAYREMLMQISKERAVFERSWKQREMQAQRVVMSSANIVGSMQGIVGASLPPIKGLELLENSEDQPEKLLE